MISKFNRFNGLFLVILLVGYFFISFLPGILGTTTRVFTIPFRAVVLGMAIYIIYRGVRYNGHVTFKTWQWGIFMIFWFLYISRMVYDLYSQRIESTVFSTTSDYMLNALGVCFIPAFAIKYADQVDYEWVLAWVFRLLGIALLTSLFFNLVNPLTGDEQYAGRYQGTAAVDTISYGHYAISFSLISIFLLSRSASYYKKAFYLASFFLGLFIMYLAGSRGPLVALIVCLLFFQINNTGLFKGLLTLFLLTVPLIIFSEEIIQLLSGFGGTFIERTLSAINKGQSSGRDVIYADAFNEFQNSPWIGNAFLVQSGPFIGFYPHNMIVEALMATGVIGSLFFFQWVYQCLRTAYKLITVGHPAAWTGVLLLQYFVYGMFSNAIFLNTGFWYCSVLIWNIAYGTYKQNQPDTSTTVAAPVRHAQPTVS